MKIDIKKLHELEKKYQGQTCCLATISNCINTYLEILDEEGFVYEKTLLLNTLIDLGILSEDEKKPAQLNS